MQWSKVQPFNAYIAKTPALLLLTTQPLAHCVFGGQHREFAKAKRGDPRLRQFVASQMNAPRMFDSNRLCH